MAQRKVAKEQWARMSENWMAEESGVRPRREVPVREVLVYDENAMETDEDMDLGIEIDASYVDLKPPRSDSQKSGEDADLAYGVQVKYDPRPTICYDEVVDTPSNEPVISREVAKRFKVRLSFEGEPRRPSIKSRLGTTQVPARREEVLNSPMSIKNRLGGQFKREDGELSEEDDSDDGNTKDNLEGHAWTKRLIGPRMKMYADEEDEKKQKIDTKAKLYNHRERSRDSLKRSRPFGIPVNSDDFESRNDYLYQKRWAQRNYEERDMTSRGRSRMWENHGRNSPEVALKNARSGVVHRNSRYDPLGGNSHRSRRDDEDERVSRRIPIKDRLGSRLDRDRRSRR